MGDEARQCAVASSALHAVENAIDALSSLVNSHAFSCADKSTYVEVPIGLVLDLYSKADNALRETARLVASSFDSIVLPAPAHVVRDCNRSPAITNPEDLELLSSAAGDRAPQGVRPTPAVSSSPQDAADARSFLRHATHRPTTTAATPGRRAAKAAG